MYGFTVNITLPSFLDATRMKTVMVAAMGLFIAFAMVSAWITKKVTTRVLSVGVFVLLSIFTYTQRTDLIDCLDKVSKAESTATKCEVAGFNVKIPTDKVPGSPVGGTGSTPTSTG